VIKEHVNNTLFEVYFVTQLMSSMEMKYTDSIHYSVHFIHKYYLFSKQL